MKKKMMAQYVEEDAEKASQSYNAAGNENW